MKSYSKPTNEQVDGTTPLLSSPQHEAYFFARLENPQWIGPLEERGVFKYPPRAESVQGGGIRHPRWPPSRYLARMASQAPEEVADIFARMETNNASIVGDILDAALALPATVAASLVPVVCRAAREGILWLGFRDAPDLCVRLADGGEIDAAMELAGALFTPIFEEGKEEPARRDAYWYRDGLKKVAPVLGAASPHKFLPRLCGWLKAAVDAKKNVDMKSGLDYSDIWRPAIEEHEQNRDYDFAGTMVGCVREEFERTVRSKSLSLEETLQIVEKYPYLVFRRIRLHLIGEFAEQNPDLACQTMLDQKLFEEYGCKHEHARLLGKRFTLLNSDQQSKWLRWIREIPTDTLKEVLTEPDDPEMSRRHRDYWRFERLHWVRDHLTGEDKQFYEEMVKECGEPDMADLNFRVGPVRWGSESPMAVDELCGMTFEQAVKTVSLWRPEGSRFTGPDREGLASTFEQYVATNPSGFSNKAMALADRPAPFVRKFLNQMGEAVNAGHEIDLSAVLELCEWVLSRPVDERTVPEQEEGALTDKDWRWTRNEISRLLESVCTAKSEGAPRYLFDGLRERIWKLIESLCHDRPESHDARDTFQGDPRGRDYLNFAINTPRGRALETALEYARWVANHVKKSDDKKEVIPGGFDTMPEVREMLEWQTDKENRTVEAMAVIGARVGLIYWIDKQWLADNANRLFPLEEMKEVPFLPETWAGWNAFLVWERTHIEFYRTFKSEFAYAVEQVASAPSTDHGREQPMRRLGEHLMFLYGWGELRLDDDEGLLRRFIKNATPDLRRHTISFVGESLEESEKVPNDVIERFMLLWEEYWGGPGKGDAQAQPDAWLFGLWFSCPHFRERWALDWLEQFVEVTPTPDPDHAVAKRLAEIAHVDPVKSVRILDRMIRGDREGWRIHSYLEPAREILKQAMKATGEPRGQAFVLIDYLGRRGYTEFGELLKDSGPVS